MNTIITDLDTCEGCMRHESICACAADMKKTEADSVKLTSLLADIIANKEMILTLHPVEQLDASEPRSELTLTGPKRLLEHFADVLMGG